MRLRVLVILCIIEIRGEYPRLPVSDECSDALSESRGEQAGDEADTMGAGPSATARPAFLTLTFK